MVTACGPETLRAYRCERTPLEKLVALRVDKKCISFYEIRKFTTFFTSALH
jgi:hypothetical protein